MRNTTMNEYMINSNMGCIKIGLERDLIRLQEKINSNMRCIETL